MNQLTQEYQVKRLIVSHLCSSVTINIKNPHISATFDKNSDRAVVLYLILVEVLFRPMTKLFD